MDEDEALFFSKPVIQRKRKRTPVNTSSDSDDSTTSKSTKSTIKSTDSQTRDVSIQTNTIPSDEADNAPKRKATPKPVPTITRQRSSSLTPPPDPRPRRMYMPNPIIPPKRVMPNTDVKPDTDPIELEIECTPELIKQELEDYTIDIIVRGVHVAFKDVNSIINDIKRWETGAQFRVRSTTRLSIPKREYCRINGVTEPDRIVLSYRSVRVFDTVTIGSLGIARDEVPLFEAFTKEGYAYVLAHPGSRHIKHPAERGRAVKSSEPDDVLRLHLRSRDGLSLNIRTRPSTSVSALIDGFKARHKLTCEVTLSFEGDVLAPDEKVGDTELEDESLVDVKIITLP